MAKLFIIKQSPLPLSDFGDHLKWPIFIQMELISKYLMAAGYIAAGIYHFVNPTVYLRIMPPWIPRHLELVYISGAAEIILGVLLLFPATQVLAAWGLIALLVAVFPANIQMMLNYRRRKNPLLWIAVLRLPVQILLIWWAWQFTK